ncbi:MAG: DMT family transporter [Proteobacteria bacterium]|jgi:drug/metabolite transporter (DMT)-like permease|nr:DMT family transporter [Pseudomonadota bacterium]
MDIKAIFLGIAFAFMWSSAFTSAHIIVASAPPLTALSLRFLISGLVGIALAKVLGQSWSLTKGQWVGTFIFGFFQNALYLGLNFVAMQTIDASLAAIIASTMPLLVALTGWLIFKERINFFGVLGLIAGVSGVVLIMGTRLNGGVDVFGLILCGIGVFALAFASLAVRGASSGGNILMIVGLQMLVGSFVLAAVALPTESLDFSLTRSVILAFLYTTFVPGLGATWVWFVLVGRIGAVRASTFHFLNPFFGVLVAYIILGESIGIMDLIGVVIITSGILMVQLSKSNEAVISLVKK